MNLAELSIKRPTFISCVVIVMLAVGWLCMQKLGVDLFPDVTFPVVTIKTQYPGAGPSEIETLVSKPLEDEISTLAGIKRLTSVNSEGFSQVVAEFTLETDIKYAEQQIRDRVGATKSKLPIEIKEPVIRRIDPSDQPVLSFALDADLSESKLYDVANNRVRPKLEQVNQVGLVEILGGRKREIHVALDRQRLKDRELSVLSVSNQLASAGENVPSGKVDQGKNETVFRTLGQFKSLEDVRNTVISFFGSDTSITLKEVARIYDSVEDETTRAYINGKRAVLIQVYRQSGANTIAVVDAVKKRIDSLNLEIAKEPGHPKISLVRDGSIWIRANVEDVKESILLGVILAVVVVFFFLGSGRSTLITGLALPNSLIGAFILMALAGFTINIMTLLALSLSVGLLIDDAIVVRENIFRHVEMGKPPRQAALEGTREVSLAVIATTFTILAVFGPVGNLKGLVGQFFKQFGLTICFAMLISLFDALTIAPMLSAYFAGTTHDRDKRNLWNLTIGRVLKGFDRLQSWLENQYEKLLRFTLRWPVLVLALSIAAFVLSFTALKKVPKTFLPPQDAGEFAVSLDLPPGTNLDGMNELASQVDQVIRKNSEVEIVSLTVGDPSGRSEVADFYVRLVPAKKRSVDTIQLKDRLRAQLAPFASANPKVKDYDAVGGGQRPFNLNLIGLDQDELQKSAEAVYERLKAHPGLKDVDMDYRPGKPEFQVQIIDQQAKLLGVSTKMLGQELRAQIEGLTPAKFREWGEEYDVRVRLEDSQRNLGQFFYKTYVPNINSRLVRLSDVARPVEARGPSTIRRQDRGRLIGISGDITPGAGIGNVIEDAKKFLEVDHPLPPGIKYVFSGQAENFQELGESIAMAMGLGVLFIFLVLASLYESFVTPFTIMLALPLALCGSFVALAISHESMNIFSQIGIIMLLGVATKNSILLVDYANQLIQSGMSRADALIQAGRTRLRPILMTTMALIAGTIPIALGLNEASRQRTSMGVAIVGGLISSTLLTLVVVPAAFSYIDRFRVWSKTRLAKLVGAHLEEKSEA